LSPWHIIVYFDELTPGNVLRPDNKRKAYLIYFTVKEFGDIIRHENAWLPIGVLRHSVLDQLPGGLSEALRELFWTFFRGPMNFQDGIEVNHHGASNKIYAVISNVLGDEAALKSCWNGKGAAGTKCCVCCKNILSKNTDLLDFADMSYFRSIDEVSDASFDLTSDLDLWSMVDRLSSAWNATTKQEFDDLQKSMGMNFCATGVLADRNLRKHIKPITCHTWDFMHTYLQNGVASVETHLFLRVCDKECGLKFSDLHKFCSSDWQQCCRESRKAFAEVFTDAREDATHDSFKGSASELLAVLPILRHVAELVVSARADLARELASFRLMHEIVITISRRLYS